jgi:hypothetical protein
MRGMPADLASRLAAGLRSRSARGIACSPQRGSLRSAEFLAPPAFGGRPCPLEIQRCRSSDRSPPAAHSHAEVRFDPAFVEEAVFLSLNRLSTPEAVSSFHREREAVYELPDAQQRDAAFQQLAHRTFETLGLAELFRARFSEFPQVPAHVELVVVRRVWNKKDEQVELYVAGAGQAPQSLAVSPILFLGLQAARCLDREKLAAFLRHELMHVADMLDPAFAYDPQAVPAWEGEPEHELIRGRFRALWDLWVHVRIRRRGWPTLLDDDARQREVARAFAFLSPSAQEELITAVSRQSRSTQGELLAMARLPAAPITVQAGHAHHEVAA